MLCYQFLCSCLRICDQCICLSLSILKDSVLIVNDLLITFNLIRSFQAEFSQKFLNFFLLFTTILVVDSGWNLQLSTYSSISPIICSILLLILILLIFYPAAFLLNFGRHTLRGFLFPQNPEQICECRRQKQLLLLLPWS